MRAQPFTLGIASGDPAPDGFVLWTRLSSEALGDVARRPVTVRWEVAHDDAFRRIAQQGSVLAVPQLAHSVHVEVSGLDPDRGYFYRFLAGDDASPTGRTRTAPAQNARLDSLRFVFCSCQNFQQGLYTAFGHLAEEDLHFVVHLGDYIYEEGVSRTPVRPHDGPEPVSLEAYRRRYELYKSDAQLQAAHAAFPFIVTPDDHEVENNYAAATAEVMQPPEQFLLRRAAAYQAYYEHQPLRRSALPRGPDMLLHRRLSFAGLADLHMLDTRQYRSDQPCNDGMRANCAAAADPRATILGTAQSRWLFDGLGRSRARWNIIASQVPIAPTVRLRQGNAEYSMDKWSGYLADRDRLLAFLDERDVPNPISIVGDVHVNWLAHLRRRYDEPAAPDIGVEFVGTSISSGGDGQDLSASAQTTLRENPHVTFFNGQRGYVRCLVKPELWTTDYRVVAYVTRPEAPIATRASFAVQSGRHHADPA